MPPLNHPSRAQRGSLLIVAMLLCAIIGISLASYIKLSRTSLAISNRAFYNNGAMNLAETGLEESMYAINQMVADSTYAWPGWTNDGTTPTSNAWRKWTGYTFDQGTTGSVRVYVYNYLGDNAPKIVARSTVTLGGATSSSIEKWIEVTLSKTSKFANGLVAKQTITFNGNNATVDSWNSDPDNNTATAAVDYDATSMNDNGSVGSISVAVGSIGVNNADIFGYASTGGAAVTVGAQGKVGPFGTGNGVIAPGHTSNNFSATFDPVAVPTATYISIGAISATTTLPVSTSDAHVTIDGIDTYYYTSPKVDFNNEALNIVAGKRVVLQLTNTTTAISIGGGSGAINIPAGSKLEIYTPGDISVAGNGVMNGGTTDASANQPINFQIWGTKTSGTQNISISGNGVFSGIIYAPQGSVSMNGGGNSGNVSGSIVANDITLNGSCKFHYDESLGNFGAGNPFRVTRWKELVSATDRTVYAGLLNF
jgi:hypothetical protein